MLPVHGLRAKPVFLTCEELIPHAPHYAAKHLRHQKVDST